jgi:hypothetical protein
LDALDRPYDLNAHSETRKNLLNALIDSRGGLSNPGSAETFASVAPGIWRVVYAPHMTIIASLVRGELSVQVSGHIIRLSYKQLLKRHVSGQLIRMILISFIAINSV